MAPRTHPSSRELGALIRSRREELGLSIEQAATPAGLGSETWRRYEAGGAIRADKVRLLCKALRWRTLPAVGSETRQEDREYARDIWKSAAESPAYSQNLARDFGEECARVFAVGCDVLSDEIDEDIQSLASMPRGSHIGELGVAWFAGRLPERWLTRYDYEFMFRLRSTICELARRAVHPGYDGVLCFTRSVADDLALHLIMEMGFVAFEGDGRFTDEDGERWEYELNGEDDEVIAVLFSKISHPEDGDHWHFDHWFDNAYYGLDQAEDAEESCAAPSTGD